MFRKWFVKLRSVRKSGKQNFERGPLAATAQHSARIGIFLEVTSSSGCLTGAAENDRNAVKVLSIRLQHQICAVLLSRRAFSVLIDSTRLVVFASDEEGAGIWPATSIIYC